MTKNNSTIPQNNGAHETAPSPSLDPVARLRRLLGEDVVLLPIIGGKKSPSIKDWQETSFDRMSDPGYLEQLAKGNIGVLQGKPSNGLCSIDIDDDADAERFLDLNPQLKDTLQSRGARGRNIWVRISGDYPPLTKLFRDEVGVEPREAKAWGEWRSSGGQTVIYGKHPSGCGYQILNAARPVEIPFDSIVWPDDLNLPWDFTLYNQLVEKHGQPYGIGKRGNIKMNDQFIAAKFAEEHAIIYEPVEQRFYSYAEPRGLWLEQTIDTVKQEIAGDLKLYADAQHRSEIERLRSNAYLTSLANDLKGHVERPGFLTKKGNVIHLKNGMLHLETNPPELRAFSPHYHSRNQCPIEFVEDADCPRFKKELLSMALDPDDIWLLQRWCGSVLLGDNYAHRILLVTGTAGGGKSTVLEVIETIIGIENVAELRTEYLGERFEQYRYLGKTLLTGKDVQAEFLMRKSVSELKKLVGHDLLSPEAKNSNTGFQMRGEFGVAITCNSRLRVRLEGDADAWRRRLMVIDYTRPKPERRISDFARLLIEKEASGILKWMIQGAMAHIKELKESADFVLTKAQMDRVEALLAESDTVREFVKRCVRVSERNDTVTVDELGQAYSTFCSTCGYHPVSLLEVEKQLPNLMEEIYRSSKRNDIKSEEGTRRGFKGVQINWSYVT